MIHPCHIGLPPPGAERPERLDAAQPASRTTIAVAPKIGVAAQTAETEKFLAAWQRWRGTALLPRRAQVDLVSICRLMPQLVVLEVRGPDKAMFRLAGTEVESQFGAPLTGRNFIKIAAPEQQESRGQRLWQMVRQPCAAIIHLATDRASGRHDELEIAAAPVLPDTAGAPIQLFAMVSRLPRQRWGVVDPIMNNIGRNLRFIDIGAGLPTEG